MDYKSTRSSINASDTAAVLQGIAPDGGLYIDPNLSQRSFDWQACLKLGPFEMAEMILGHLLPGFDNMAQLVDRAYRGKFASEELTPLKDLGEDYVLELFHGPTCAFKDVALSMLPQLIMAGREKENIKDKIVILTATSGDTGKAALEGFHDVEGTGIIVFYPDEGVSPVQKAQMVTQEGGNVCVCAVKGNFDDCQQGVKEAFAKINSGDYLKDKALRLSSANSINIGRLAPQVVYYFIAYASLLKKGRIELGDKVDFSVPTGNFGDILAGAFAKLMGLPVGKLICASNANRVLTDFINTGVYDRRREFFKTTSPSMDILVSSNLERLLYIVSKGDEALVSKCMNELKEQGFYKLEGTPIEMIQKCFAAYCCDEENTEKTIAKVWNELHYLCDPHTAVGVYAAEEYKKQRSEINPVVVLSTASPYKFPAAVLKAIGGDMSGDEFNQSETLEKLSAVPMPKALSGLRDKEVLHKDVIDRSEILDYVLKKLLEAEE
ncbi:MAG: threonine synthase [Oscillospiraceae bacterium]|nr:threonine synthase [Oscillospiraceae bacterium]